MKNKTKETTNTANWWFFGVDNASSFQPAFTRPILVCQQNICFVGFFTAVYCIDHDQKRLNDSPENARTDTLSEAQLFCSC